MAGGEVVDTGGMEEATGVVAGMKGRMENMMRGMRSNRSLNKTYRISSCQLRGKRMVVPLQQTHPLRMPTGLRRTTPDGCCRILCYYL